MIALFVGGPRDGYRHEIDAWSPEIKVAVPWPLGVTVSLDGQTNPVDHASLFDIVRYHPMIEISREMWIYSPKGSSVRDTLFLLFDGYHKQITP